MNRHSERDIETDPLHKRVGRFIAWVTTVFAITAAVVITQRLSEDSLALLVGLTCGAAAMMPTLGLGLLLWRREDVRREQTRQQQAAPTPAVAPPVVVVAPQPMAGYGMSHPALAQVNAQAWGQQAPAQRQFMIVGGEE